ncbi:hypothetical protein VTK73DRAFT_979 [Phialemonium thermophilum]|uniref:PD-(D/E)XK nuclease-like domain-containing protein n=1 Tax=Phialemonium thermophilum TaxID=223376 RepID=A0ABR3XCT6_9PEZI
MLELALEGVDSVSYELITTAPIIPDFLPVSLASSGLDASTDITESSMPSAVLTSQQKMVDFAILLEADEGLPLQSAITTLLERRLSLGQKSINQTDYGRLIELPAPIAIETKTAEGSVEEAKVQLGVWTAAWFRRMKMLMRDMTAADAESTPSSSTTQRTSATTISIPLLLVVGERWSLFYACEQNGRITISTSEVIGDTSTILGIYKLMRCLRSIGQWLRGICALVRCQCRLGPFSITCS